MKYLKLKGKNSKRIRKNGTKNIVPLFVKKSRKYGSVQQEISITRKKNIIIAGAHNSGKSRTLSRLYEYALDIWGGHSRVHGKLLLEQVQPLSAWYESSQIIDWYERKNKKHPKKYFPWHKLKAWQKVDLLPRYCKEKNIALFIDNANKLTGRKLDVAKKCINSARVVILTTSEEGRLPPSIRQSLLLQTPQIIRLDSDVAYDATGLVIWAMIGLCLMVGAYPLAMVLGGMKVLGTGRRASRQH